MTTTQTITEADWREQFQPHEDENQTAGLVNYEIRRDDHTAAIVQARAERRLWTYCQTGVGNYYIEQGFALVNREFYIIGDVPVPEDAEYNVESEESFYCELCGHWFKDMNDSKGSVERSNSTGLSTCVKCEAGEEPDDEGDDA